MAHYEITGGKKLSGQIEIDGAKNSALPILAAAYLCEGEVVLHNCPMLSDVIGSIEILSSLGSTVTAKNNVLHISPPTDPGSSVSDELMRKMRSSVIFLGAMLARTGRAELTYPGGCVLGSRPIDLHIDGLAKLGAEFMTDGGCIHCTAPNGLVGSEISLSFPSVGATENLMIAACTAKGTTYLNNAAREPEIADLAQFLNECGANIQGAGEGTIKIEGVSHLGGCHHIIIPDRIVAATFLSAAVITQGDLFLKGAVASHLSVVLSTYRALGSSISADENGIYISHRGRPKSMNSLRTMPYPGYPTDAQPMLVSALCYGLGTSIVTESIFENRFKYTEELFRMGAKITVRERTAIIEGRPSLYGAETDCGDLRGGAAITVAALCAQGKTILNHVEHIERGYFELEKKLAAVGALIKKED